MQKFFKKSVSLTICFLSIILTIISSSRLKDETPTYNSKKIFKSSFNLYNFKVISNCEREIFFDGNKLCFPKIENWKECRTDKNLISYVDNLELNSRILAFYIPNSSYSKSKKEEIFNFPIISLFVHSNTIGMKTTKDALQIVYAGLKNSFQNQNWIYIENLLKSKTNTVFTKPILFDSYSVLKNVKTCVTINSSKYEGETIHRVSFINILDIKQRIVMLNYSKVIGKNFQYNVMKIDNDKIVRDIVSVN